MPASAGRVSLLLAGLLLAAASAWAQPLPLFLEPERIPPEVQAAAQRMLSAYPDAGRHRVVTLNHEVITRVFGKYSKQDYVSAVGVLLVDVGKGVGVGTEVTLNFFADRSFETVVDKSAAFADRGVHYWLQLRGESEPPGKPLIGIGISNPASGREDVRLDYEHDFAGPTWFSVRRISDTPFHLIIERSRGRNLPADSVLQPDLLIGSSLPVRIDGGMPGVTAEVGGHIDYGVADFSFGDGEIGYAISSSATAGHPPRAFKTVDGGTTWNPLRVEPDWVPVAIYFRNRNDGFLTLRFNPVGHSTQNIRGCAVLRTQDGGATWEHLQNAGADHCLHSVTFAKGGTGYAIGWDKRRRVAWLWRSTDAGREWSRWVELRRFESWPERIAVLGDEIVVIPALPVGPIGCGILVFDREGRRLPPLCLTFPHVEQLRFVSRDVIFANVEDELGNYLLRSTNGGETWRRVREGRFRIVYAGSAREIGLIVRKGRTSASDVSSPVSAFAYSNDGGRTWAEGPTLSLNPYAHGKFQRLDDGTELTLLENNVLSVRGR